MALKDNGESTTSRVNTNRLSSLKDQEKDVIPTNNKSNCKTHYTDSTPQHDSYFYTRKATHWKNTVFSPTTAVLL